jgi:hypothetical protein
MPLDKVNRGDLISADLINALIDEIEILKQQIGHTGSAPVIALITPSSDLHIGDALDIRGENFRVTQGAQLVTFDGVLVTAYKSGTTDTRLFINIPDIPGIPEAGKNVDLVIANGIGSTSRPLLIQPPELALEGDIVDVFWDDINPNPMMPLLPASINYRLRSRAGQTATFTLVPTILTAGWPNNAQILIDGAVSSTGQVQLARLQEKAFTVRIPLVPTLPPNATVEIRVTATVGRAIGSDQRSFTIGQVTVPADNTFSVAPQSFTVLNERGLPDPQGGSYNDATGTIQAKPGKSGLMGVRVEFTQIGIYDYTLEHVGTAPVGWAVGFSGADPNQPSQTSQTIEQSDFSGGATRVPRTTSIRVTTAANDASANGEIRLRIQRRGSLSSQTRNFKLALLP